MKLRSNVGFCLIPLPNRLSTKTGQHEDIDKQNWLKDLNRKWPHPHRDSACPPSSLRRPAVPSQSPPPRPTWSCRRWTRRRCPRCCSSSRCRRSWRRSTSTSARLRGSASSRRSPTRRWSSVRMDMNSALCLAESIVSCTFGAFVPTLQNHHSHQHCQTNFRELQGAALRPPDERLLPVDARNRNACRDSGPWRQDHPLQGTGTKKMLLPSFTKPNILFEAPVFVCVIFSSSRYIAVRVDGPSPHTHPVSTSSVSTRTPPSGSRGPNW